MKSGKQRIIGIFGFSAPRAGSDKYKQAYELGKSLAEAGYGVANGGYGGTMAAAAEGAREKDGQTIGVTCEAFGRGGPNQWIDKEIRTKDLAERVTTLINLADAYIVLPGSTGTLLEIAMVWELINKQFVGQRPIIFLSRYWEPVISTVRQGGETEGSFIKFADTQESVLQLLNEYFTQTYRWSV